jgi:rhodanese-related sulfurtransferase
MLMTGRTVLSLWLCFFLWFSLAGSAVGKEPAAKGQKRQKTAPVSSGSGKARDRDGIPSDLLQGKLRRRDTSLYVPVDSVLRKIGEKQRPLLVDVRGRDEFEKFRIPGSIHMPLFALKTKLFLKSERLVLVNEGFNYRELERECRLLRSSGFSQVLIMYGGLACWHRKGGALEGDVFAPRELRNMSPQDVFAERDYADWIAVDISESMSAESRRLMPRAVSVPYRGRPEDFRSSLGKTLRPHSRDSLVSVLIYNTDGAYPEKVERVVREAAAGSVFFLQGGLDGYRSFLRQQALMAQAEKSKITVKKCPTCP